MPSKQPFPIRSQRTQPVSGQRPHGTRWLGGATAVLIALALSACASTQLQTQVEAFSTLQSLPTQAAERGYRFERLPSQQAQGAAQDELEQQARVALAHVGLDAVGSPALPDGRPRYAVQVSLHQVELPLPGYGLYGPDAYWGWGWGGPGLYGGAWAAPFWSSGRTETRSELTLLLRDLHDHQVVFEGHALHSDLPVARDVLIPALLDAALRDFPHPPRGTRQVIIDLTHSNGH